MWTMRKALRILVALAFLAAPLVHGGWAAAQSHAGLVHGDGASDTSHDAGGAAAGHAAHQADCGDDSRLSPEDRDDGDPRLSTCAACVVAHCFPAMLGVTALVLPAPVAGTDCPDHAASAPLGIHFPKIDPPRA